MGEGVAGLSGFKGHPTEDYAIPNSIGTFFDMLAQAIKERAGPDRGLPANMLKVLGTAKDVRMMGRDTILNRLINADQDQNIDYQEIYDYITYRDKKTGVSNQQLLEKWLGKAVVAAALFEINQYKYRTTSIPLAAISNRF
ncbi:MAG: hypothetical protein V4691_03800 [Pseudomonadota bacterium]